MKDFLKTIFFRPAWYAIFVNPYFIARRKLYKEMYQFSKTITNAKILDLGCGSKPYAFLFQGNEYIGIDINSGGHNNSAKNNDLFFDGKTIPFADDYFDLVICTQVIEHAEQPEMLLQETHRVLKETGILYLTCPFVWQEHETPYDFRRYTQYGLKKILEENKFKIEKIISTTGIFATTGQLLSSSLFEMAGKSFVFRLLIAIIWCFPIQFVFGMSDFIFGHKGITLDYVLIAKKYGL